MKLAVLALAILLGGCSRPGGERSGEETAPSAPKITQFYADRGEVGPDERALLCYGVEDTKQVRLSPPVEELSPSFNRCIEVRPQATTEYTLTALGEDGHEATATLTIRRGARTAEPRERPAAAAPLESAGGLQILEFTAKPSQIARGGAATLCYAVQGANSVRVQPSPVQLGAVQRGCFYVNPPQSTAYTLTAEAGGKTVSRQINVTVQ
jgi:hypothetical protein